MSRHVAIHDSPYNPYIRTEDISRFQRCITSFLKKIGIYLDHLSIHFEHSIPTLTLYHLLRHWLSLATNLRTLRISWNWFVRKSHAAAIRAEQIQLAPMPSLKNLKVLKAENPLPIIFRELLKTMRTLGNSSCLILPWSGMKFVFLELCSTVWRSWAFILQRTDKSTSWSQLSPTGLGQLKLSESTAILVSLDWTNFQKYLHWLFRSFPAFFLHKYLFLNYRSTKSRALDALGVPIYGFRANCWCDTYRLENDPAQL